MARMIILRVSEILTRFEGMLSRALNLPCHPALGVDVAHLPTACNNNTKVSSTADAKSLIDSIFDGLFLAAVPKYRRSRERIAIRRFGQHKVRAFMTPRQNLTECLTCGTWHERHTICGECYKKVKEETEEMRSKMTPDVRLYNVPHSEVVYSYKGEEEDRKMHDGKYIVEMDKPRPEWFPKNLLTRGHGKH